MSFGIIIPMRKHFYFLIVFPISLAVLGMPSELLAELLEIEQQIQSAFGTVERNAEGVIIGVDLARGRASATDEVLQSALLLPNLKRLRFAGGHISAESLARLAKQRVLEELYLQDVPIRDADWKPLLAGHPQLVRLTLRRMPNLSGAQLASLPRKLPALRNLSLIDMNLSGDALAEIAQSETLAALDIRNCSRVSVEDYRCLTSMPKLADLKIGGFSITDDVLEVIAPLPFLRGLTIDDTLITPGGFEQFVSSFASAAKLETLVLSRNSALFDEAMLPIKKFPNLKRLTVNGMMVTGSFLERLAEDETTRPKLLRLSLRKAFLSEEGMAALKQFPELRILDISGVALTPELITIVLSLNRLEELDVTGCGLDKNTLLRLESMPSLKRLLR